MPLTLTKTDAKRIAKDRYQFMIMHGKYINWLSARHGEVIVKPSEADEGYLIVTQTATGVVTSVKIAKSWANLS